MENEEEIFDECMKRAQKMAHKYMPNPKDMGVRKEEFALALFLFKKEVDEK